MAAYSWNLTTDGNWNNAADWSPGGVPTAADTVDFNSGGNTYIVNGNGAASSITVSADIVTFEGSITASNNAAVPGLAANSGGDVLVDQTAAVATSSLAFDTGTLLQVNGLLVDYGSPTPLGEFVYKAIVQGGTMVAAAAVTFDQLYVYAGGTYTGDITLDNGGSLTLDTTSLVSGSTLGSTLNLLGNGTVYVSNVGTETTGTYALTEAITTIAGDGLTLADDPGVIVTVSGGISGAGYVDVNAGNIVLAGGNTYTGGTLVDNAAVTLAGAGAAGTGAIFLTAASLTSQADGTGAAGAATVVGAAGADTVSAQAGNLLVFGGDATAMTFQGGANASTVVGSGGVLTATGGNGSDLIFGGSSGLDVLTTGSGATTLVGGLGGRLVALGAASNVLVATAGNTTLTGGASSGNNVFFTGGTGTTIVESGTGTATIVAGGAANFIYGAKGTENVFLSGGTSQLDFTAGFDGGTMNVIGFGAGDTLHLTLYDPAEPQAAIASEVVNSGNTILTLSDNTHIVLFGVTGLTTASFV